MNDTLLPPLIRGLLSPAAYPHPVQPIRLVETHISWVLLTGPHAYKVKKPVDLGFLDFSTLDQRQRACEEELRLNRRLAADLYQAVVPITGSLEEPRMGGVGEALEYAVRMRQFDPEQQLDRVLARGELQARTMDRLAARLAAFHADIPAAGAERPFGTPEAVATPMRENFRQIRPRVTDPADLTRLDRLAQWTETHLAALHASLATRKRDGFVRECHGDLHLANMALDRDRDGEVIVFDCIEFNPNLRWIDVMSEMAFLTMDLTERGRPDLAARCLNGYLEHTGDYSGLGVLRLYQVYRAMVRAKIAAIRLSQEDPQGSEAEATRGELRGYLDLARAYTEPAHPFLAVTRGVSGSGKTTLTQPLLERLSGVRIRSDVERKRLFGLAPLERSGSALSAGIYTAEASVRTYARLEELAAGVLRAGLPVFVEATFLRRDSRERMRALAAREGVPFALLDFRADPRTLRDRVAHRQAQASDASEADVAVLENQLASREPLGADESAGLLVVDTEARPEPEVLAARLAELTRKG
jgi:aminoglycoside phosphotransferase family enzyme/predicted kinase